MPPIVGPERPDMAAWHQHCESFLVLPDACCHRPRLDLYAHSGSVASERSPRTREMRRSTSTPRNTEMR